MGQLCVMAKDKTPKDIKQFRDYIRKMADNLRCNFYLQEYELDWEWHEDEAPDPQGDGRTGAAKITTDCVYLGITLSVYHELYSLWIHKQHQKIYQIMVHEFCHVLLSPIIRELKIEMHPNSHTFIEDIHERQTQRIANVILYSDFSKTKPK
jgi:hypothetical protein